MTVQSVQPDATSWDAFAEHTDGHILQTTSWGMLKRAFGWRDEIIALADHTGAIRSGALVLLRPLPLSIPGSLAYIPRGPLVDWENQLERDALMDSLHSNLRQSGAFALKLEPAEDDSPAIRETLIALGFRPSARTIQPPRTIRIDIAGSEEDILMRMSQSTRRKVRMGAKKDVVVRRGSAADLDSFNALMGTTGARNQIGVHSAAYYRLAYQIFAPDHAALIIASHQGKDLAALMVFAFGTTSWYFYGASSNEERERMPTYAIQWEAIRWAREHGCTTYDLWGIPDEDQATLESQFQTRSDGLWGVYGFKRGFGGEVVRSAGAWDYVYNPVLYNAYRLVLAGRAAAQG